MTTRINLTMSDLEAEVLYDALDHYRSISEKASHFDTMVECVHNDAVIKIMSKLIKDIEDQTT